MNEKEDFTVRDRRASSHGVQADPQVSPRERNSPTPPEPAGQDVISQPDMDFSAFVISLASAAQLSLGAIPHPGTNESTISLPEAKQMIDILALLQVKTKGNLTDQESALLQQVLASLRMHYVRTVEGQKKSGG